MILISPVGQLDQAHQSLEKALSAWASVAEKGPKEGLSKAELAAISRVGTRCERDSRDTHNPAKARMCESYERLRQMLQ